MVLVVVVMLEGGWVKYLLQVHHVTNPSDCGALVQASVFLATSSTEVG